MSKFIDIALYLLAAVCIAYFVTALEMKKNEYEKIIDQFDEKKFYDPIDDEDVLKPIEDDVSSAAMQVFTGYQKAKQSGKKSYYKKKFLPRLFKRR